MQPLLRSISLLTTKTEVAKALTSIVCREPRSCFKHVVILDNEGQDLASKVLMHFLYNTIFTLVGGVDFLLTFSFF